MSSGALGTVEESEAENPCLAVGVPHGFRDHLLFWLLDKNCALTLSPMGIERGSPVRSISTSSTSRSGLPVGSPA